MEKQLTFAAIQRHTTYSPNHIGNDSAIIHAVAKQLGNNGHKVHFYTEQEFIASGIEEQYVFTMLRNKLAVQRLKELEKERGVVAVNSAFGIENCGREQMTRLLLAAGISYPKSWIVDTQIIFEKMKSEIELALPFWIKRADFHAIHREDVTYVRSHSELKQIISEYALRGIDRVVISEHLEGDLIKFYGVYGTPFFYWFYPYFNEHSKFGIEKINGKPQGLSFEESQLKEMCNAAAAVLNVKVYGGDCIVSPQGEVSIIDFNDWPSFAPCRDDAAQAIAQVILKTIQENESIGK